jgi:membrane fusion protein, multidrug efflux system
VSVVSAVLMPSASSSVQPNATSARANEPAVKNRPFRLRAGFGLSAIALAVVLTGCSKETTKAPDVATEVAVYTVQPQSVNLTHDLPGRTVAVASAEIIPQVDGIVQQRLFKEGSLVKAGQALYQLDPATYRAAYNSAMGAQAKAEATLAADKLTYDRQKKLLSIEATTQQDFEDAQAAFKEAEADLITEKAAVETAKINLDRTRITSPISGRVDTSTVTQGALVTADQSTALTTVQQLDPIYVDIPQSSVDVLKLRREVANGTLKDGTTRVRLTLEDGSPFSEEGTLEVNGVSVSTSTGAITLRATFPNPKHLLLPGMYVHAVLEQATDPAALMVPQQGVQRDTRGNAYAMVVGTDGKVEKRDVKVGESINNQWRVTSGLKAGDRVIVEGVSKVKDGQIVHAVASALATSAAASDASPSVAAATAAASAASNTSR